MGIQVGYDFATRLLPRMRPASCPSRIKTTTVEIHGIAFDPMVRICPGGFLILFPHIGEGLSGQGRLVNAPPGRFLVGGLAVVYKCHND